MIEAKDIFTTVVTGAVTVSGLLLVLMGFLFSAKDSLIQRSPLGARKYQKLVWIIFIVLTLNTIITLFGLAWALGLICFLNTEQTSFLILLAFGIVNLAIIPLSLWLLLWLG